jgi:hypothetical protein
MLREAVGKIIIDTEYLHEDRRRAATWWNHPYRGTTLQERRKFADRCHREM